MTQSPRIISAQVRFLRRRDGDACALCGDPIDFSIRGKNDPMGCSRDHIIPAARGGPSLAWNLRLAHRSCNEQRGSRLTREDIVQVNANKAYGSPRAGQDQRYSDVSWDDRMSARQPAGGRVLYLGEEPSLPCA